MSQVHLPSKLMFMPTLDFVDRHLTELFSCILAFALDGIMELGTTATTNRTELRFANTA